MPNDSIILRALRKEDFLDLTFELINIRIEGTPLMLVRNSVNEPAILIIHFPPQHIVEETFPIELESVQTPVRARMSGPSRLVFRLPDNENTWPFTLETLLDWKSYIPLLPFNALPPDASDGLDLQQPTAKETALEIPTGLIISPDESGFWTHMVLPVLHNEKFELWHTRLRKYEKGINGASREGGTSRVIWTPNPDIPFENSLTKEDRNEIVHLTSDFNLPKFQPPSIPTELDYILWLQELTRHGLPIKYIPRPLNIRHLMLSSYGAWVNLEGGWDYPTISDENSNLGYPKFNLKQWKHITAQGRDQYVKTVKKGFLCDTGHRVSIVTITERVFEPTYIGNWHTAGSDGRIIGSKAILRKRQYLEIEEPVREYTEMEPVYVNGGREMPFKRIHITTRSTPNIENVSDTPFWPMAGGVNFLFQMVAEDWEGNSVYLDRPLYCVPLSEGQMNWYNIVNDYNNNGNLGLRSVPIRAQSVAFAETEPDKRGKTTLKTDIAVFEAQVIAADKRDMPANTDHPFFLPTVKCAWVRLPTVEKLLGCLSRQITFDSDYLSKGLSHSSNQGEVFANLTQKLSLSVPAEKAGGLVKPDIEIDALSRCLGPVANSNSIKQGIIDISMFDKTRFLGSISLKDILPPGKSFNQDQIKVADLRPEELWQKMNSPEFRLEVPILTTTSIYPEGTVTTDPTVRPLAIETRYLWKPLIQDYSIPTNPPLFEFLTQKGDTGFGSDAQLLLLTRLITPLDQEYGDEASRYEVSSFLKDFALKFAGVIKLKFESMVFHAENGKKMDVSAHGMGLEFEGPLKFVDTLRSIIPSDGFSDPPFIEVMSSGIRAGYTLGIPSLGIGIFSLQNISLGTAISLPFINQPAGIRFFFSERHNPFLVTVGIFGGGGFFAIALNAGGIEQIEAAIEFGGNICLNLGVASGGIHAMAGIYFGMTGTEVKLTGYFRCGGYLSVLGIISISVEFYLGFTYRQKGNGGEVWGQASLSVCVKIAFFSKSVTLTVERRFAGAAGDPTFAQLTEPADWEEYCKAFA